MSADAKTRKTVRERIVTHFKTDLVGTGLPVVEVYSYDRRDFKGQSPVVLVLSAGVGRVPFGLGTEHYGSVMRFSVLAFTREADESESWTPANVEDSLDLVEKSIANSVMNHRKDPGYWTELMFDSSEISDILPALVGGVSYKMEVMTLLAEVYDG